MNIIRRNPSALAGYRPRGMDEQFGRLVESMFEDMFAPFTHAGALSQSAGDGVLSARLDVSETDQAFEIQADMPGRKKGRRQGRRRVPPRDHRRRNQTRIGAA